MSIFHFLFLMQINQGKPFIQRFAPIFISIFFALREIPACLYCCALMYAEYTPLELTLQVFFLHIGNDFLGPKKHRVPQCFNMTVL
jgi:hypothetical protein